MNDRIITINIGHWPVHLYLERYTKYQDSDLEYALSNAKLPLIFQQYIENIVLDDVTKKFVNERFVGDGILQIPVDRYNNQIIVNLFQSNFNFGIENNVRNVIANNCIVYKNVLNSKDTDVLMIFKVMQGVLGINDCPGISEDLELDDFADVYEKNNIGENHTDNRFFIKVYKDNGQPNFTIMGPNDGIFLNKESDTEYTESFSQIIRNIPEVDESEKPVKRKLYSWIIIILLILIIVALVLFLDLSIYTPESIQKDEWK